MAGRTLKFVDSKGLSNAPKKNHIKIFQNTRGKEKILAKCFLREKAGHV